MTQQLSIDGHAVIARCDASHDEAARSMLEKFEQIRAKGGRIEPGIIIDFGWAPLQIQAHDGEWLVCEPDFDTEPMCWRLTVDNTLRVLQMQAELIHTLHIQPQRTRGDQMLWLAPDALDAERVYLHRDKAESSDDSGWYIGRDRASDETGDVQRARQVRAGTLWSRKPQWVAVLALPAETLVNFDKKGLAEIYDSDGQAIFERDHDA